MIEAFPWWVKWVFIGGTGLMSATTGIFKPDYQMAGFIVGAILFVLSILGAAIHLIKMNRRKNMGPIYLIGTGALIILLGVGWEIYNSIVSPIVDITESKENIEAQSSNDFPKSSPRYYSKAEKECIGDGLFKLSRIVLKDGWKTREDVDRLGLGWQYYIGKSVAANFTEAISEYLQELEAVKKRAVSTYDSLIMILSTENIACESDLKVVADFQQEATNNPLFKIRMSIAQLNDALLVLRDINPKPEDGKRQQIIDLVKLTEPNLRDTIVSLDTWLRKTQIRIDTKSQELGE